METLFGLCLAGLVLAAVLAATETTGTLTAEVKTFYDRRLLEAAEPKLVHLRWAQERDIPMHEGDTINFRRFELLDTKTTAITEGVTPPGDNVTITQVTATPLQYGGFITFSDKVSWVAIDKIKTEFSKLQGQQAGNTLDEITRDVIIAGSTVN
jgi:N4-gp56 family major capsid protein